MLAIILVLYKCFKLLGYKASIWCSTSPVLPIISDDIIIARPINPKVSL